MTREERLVRAKPRLDFVKAVAKSIGQFLYQYETSVYTHYVDERDACASWCPLSRMENAMQVAIHHGFSIIIDKSDDNGMAVAITLNGEVLAMQEGPEQYDHLVMRAICLAAGKMVGFNPEDHNG